MQQVTFLASFLQQKITTLRFGNLVDANTQLKQLLETTA